MRKFILFPLHDKLQVIDSDYLTNGSVFSSVDTLTHYGNDDVADLYVEFYLSSFTWYLIAVPVGCGSLIYMVEDDNEFDAVMQVVGDDLEGEFDGDPPTCIGVVDRIKVETINFKNKKQIV